MSTTVVPVTTDEARLTKLRAEQAACGVKVLEIIRTIEKAKVDLVKTRAIAVRCGREADLLEEKFRGEQVERAHHVVDPQKTHEIEGDIILDITPELISKNRKPAKL